MAAINLLAGMPKLTGANPTLGSMGVTAKSPTTNVSGPATTLPKAQVAAAPTSSLTATNGLGQMQAANSAMANKGLSGISVGSPATQTGTGGNSNLTVAGMSPLTVASGTKTPATTTTPPATGSTSTSSAPATYKGTAITPGTDAQVAAQIAQIDKNNTASNNLATAAAPSSSVTAGPLATLNIPNTPGTQPWTGTPNSAVTTPDPNANRTDVNGNLLSTGQPPASFSGLLGAAANQANSPYNQSAQGSLAGAQGASQATYGQGYGNAQGAYGQAQNAYQALGQLQQNAAAGQGAIYSEAIPLQFQQGRAQALQSMYGNQEQALATEAAGLGGLYTTAAGQQSTGIGGLNSAAGNAISGQSVTQSGLLGAAGLAQPVMQAGMLTNPQNGQPLNPSLVSTAVQQATQLVQNGASVNDPQVQALLNPFGYYGASAFTQAEQALNNGGYNPTQQAGAAGQNATQAATTQGAAYDMSTAIHQLSTLEPTVMSFLASSGLSSSQNPDVNAAMNTYYGSFLNPGNKQIFEQYMGDIQKYTSQILAAGSGLIPTATSQAIASFDPRNLSVAQLKPYLDSLALLGNNQVSNLQSQRTASGGTANGYAGTPTTTSTTPVTAPANTPSQFTTTTSNPIIQGLIGGAMNIVGGVTGAVSGLAHTLLQ